LKRLVIHWENLRTSKNLEDFFGYLSGRFERLVLWFVKFRPVRLLVEHSNITVQDKNTASRVAAAWYLPSPYPGDVVLFTVSQRPSYMTWDPMAGWKDLIHGDLVIREVTGSHMNLLKEPHARELARQLKECLDGDKDRRSTAPE
jgi:hypothetical protein